VFARDEAPIGLFLLLQIQRWRPCKPPAVTVKRAARALGLPPATPRAWSKDAARKKRLGKKIAEKRGQLADQFDTLARMLLNLSLQKLAKANVVQVITACGIAIDKMLLLRAPGGRRRGEQFACPDDPADG
jgi:hypothetical protein